MSAIIYLTLSSLQRLLLQLCAYFYLVLFRAWRLLYGFMLLLAALSAMLLVLPVWGVGAYRNNKGFKV